VISIIVCSINKTRLAQLKKSIVETIGVAYEIVVIDNSDNNYSLPQAYNKGASQAKFPYLCFVHEDILFHTQEWGNRLIKHFDNSSIALVGIFGSIIKTKVPSGVHIPIENMNRVNQLQRDRDGKTVHFYENPLNEPYSEVAVLDGMFLATTISNHNKYPFDEHLLTNFHGYDIDYSLGQSRFGPVVVVYDILIEHFSHGEYSIPWINEQLKLTNKWFNYLPRYVSIGEKHISPVTNKNIEKFLLMLCSHNYKKDIQLKYLLQLIRRRPISLKNLYYIRKFLISGKIEQWLKSMQW
jgi:glycosyltransferase involved in cell wall biosynthesis